VPRAKRTQSVGLARKKFIVNSGDAFTVHHLFMRWLLPEVLVVIIFATHNISIDNYYGGLDGNKNVCNNKAL